MSLLGFGFASFAMWARKCAVAVHDSAPACANEAIDEHDGPSLFIEAHDPYPHRQFNNKKKRENNQGQLLFIRHTASAHFLASIARSACTAVFPKEVF